MPTAARTALTRAQLGLWLGHQRATDPTVFHAAECVLLTGRLEVAHFREALTRTMAEARALHVAFVERRGTPWRCEVPFGGVRLVERRVEIRGGIREAMAQHALESSRRPLAIELGELQRHELVELGPELHAWIHVAHHLALDGYGFQLVARRVAAHYGALLAGQAPLPAMFTDFAPVLAEDQAYEASGQRDRDRQRWAAELGDAPPATRRAAATGASRGVRRHLRWPTALFDAASAEARARGLGWNDVLLAALAVELGKRADASRFVLGFPVMQRLGRSSLRTPCTAMNIVPVPVDLARAASLTELAADLRRTLLRNKPLERYRHEDLALDRAALAPRPFGPIVNVLPFEEASVFGNCAAEVLRVTAGPVDDLVFGLAPRPEGLDISVDRHAVHDEESEVEALLVGFRGGVEAWLREPDAPLARPAPRPSMHGTSPTAALHAHADARPEAMALESSQGDLRWSELARAVTSAARWLLRQRVGPGDLVALELRRGPLAVVSILAALEIGAAWVALEPEHPAARRAAILARARPTLLLREEGTPGHPGVPDRVVDAGLLASWRAEDGPRLLPPPVSAASPAYVVFTSGSSGEPKGVEISRGALAHFATVARASYGIGASDRVLQFAPLGFDACVEEIFVSLLAGATLVLRDDAALQSIEAFLASCRASRITVLDLPTAYWHELARAAGERGLAAPETLKLVIIGGEAASAAHARSWKRVCPHARLLNTYGPSEATVVATFAEITGQETELPIGRALLGVTAVVVPDGDAEDGLVRGELHLAGPTLANGYRGRPDLTRERFVTLPGIGRAYRTGDRVEQRPTGELLFRGRVDDDVKISGCRIAPAEVERTLTQHPLVEAAVVWGEAHEGGARLLGVVEGSPELDPRNLRAFCAEHLPAPMVPTHLTVERRLPRNASGKIDRAAVRGILPATSARARGPVSEVEGRVLSAWHAVLGERAIDLDDDFFALGGQSLALIQLASRLGDIGVDVRVADLFRHPTPRAQARFLSEGASQARGLVQAVPLGPLPSVVTTEVGGDRVLFTGATGFVGGHVLTTWLERSSCRAVCLVRAADADEGRRRLIDASARRGLSLDAFADRLEIVAVGLTAPDLGSRLLASVERCADIVHCAADVSLVRDEASLRATNVTATAELLRLAGRWGARFHFTSTIATLPAEGDVSEAYHPSHEGLRDGYQRTKWQAEALCAEADAQGLAVSVHRLGRVCPPASATTIEASDLLWRVARSAVRARVWPALDIREPWILADVAARAMFELRHRHGVWHLLQGGLVAWSSVRDALRTCGYELDEVDLPAWLGRVGAQADQDDRATLGFFEQHMPAAAPGEPDWARVSWTRTESALGGSPAETIGPRHLAAYCRAAIATGLLPAPGPTNFGATERKEKRQ